MLRNLRNEITAYQCAVKKCYFVHGIVIGINQTVSHYNLLDKYKEIFMYQASTPFFLQFFWLR